jgi:hypothetical protein
VHLDEQLDTSSQLVGSLRVSARRAYFKICSANMASSAEASPARQPGGISLVILPILPGLYVLGATLSLLQWQALFTLLQQVRAHAACSAHRLMRHPANSSKGA